MKTIPCKHCNGTGKVPDQRALGEEMRKRRESLGYSLREAAFRMSISAPYLSDLELGRRNWNEAIRKAFLKAVV